MDYSEIVVKPHIVVTVWEGKIEKLVCAELSTCLC